MLCAEATDYYFVVYQGQIIPTLEVQNIRENVGELVSLAPPSSSKIDFSRGAYEYHESLRTC